jgi:signal transduction histidine kinase
LAVPLLAQKGPLGLLMVYTREGESHSETQRAMLETLALHVASALSNASAYAQLRLTQEQLVQREKLAALGRSCGVAHELNTPLGNALLLTSTLNERVRELPAEAPAGDEAQAALGQLRQLVTQAGPLIERSLLCAARLMSSFKQVAVDQAADRRRSFDLAQAVTELATTLHNQLQPQQHKLSVFIPAGIVMDGYPGALLQVLTNLMLNAIQHGLAGRQHGHISIVASRVRKDAVLIQFSDNGYGISDAHLKRVFELFFTTRLAMGGTGLGLSISYNIVTAVLGGSIQVSSPPGSGAVFRMVLPLVAPGERGTPLPGSAGTSATGLQV